MGIKLPSNLHRNRHGVLYFRLHIPKDIRCYFETSTIYRSLNTSSVRRASDDARVLALKAKLLFKELRSNPMDKKSKTPAEAWNEFIQLPDLRLRIRKAGLQVAVEEQAAELARQEQLIANLDLEKALMKQQHTEQLLQLQQLHTETVQSLARDTSLIDTSAPEQIHALSSASAKSQRSRPPVGKCLSAYVESYIDSINANREAEDKINEQGIGDHRRTCKLLIEILGDKPLSELNIRDRNYFDDVIKRYPVNREKKRELKGKTL